MTDAEMLAAIHHDLGALKGQLTALKEEFRASAADAADSRRKLHRRFDEVNTRVTVIEPELKRVSDWVNNAVVVEAQGKAVIAVGRWLGVRAMRLLKWALAAIGAALVAFWRELLDLFMAPK